MSGENQKQLKEFMALPKEDRVSQIAASLSQMRLCPVCDSLCNKKLEQCYECDHVFSNKETE